MGKDPGPVGLRTGRGSAPGHAGRAGAAGMSRGRDPGVVTLEGLGRSVEGCVLEAGGG